MGHSARGSPGLLFPGDAPKVFFRHGQQALELAHPVIGDVTGFVGLPGPFQQAHGFLMVGLGHVQCVLEGGFVLKCRFVVHATSVVRFPG